MSMDRTGWLARSIPRPMHGGRFRPGGVVVAPAAFPGRTASGPGAMTVSGEGLRVPAGAIDSSVLPMAHPMEIPGVTQVERVRTTARLSSTGTGCGCSGDSGIRREARGGEPSISRTSPSGTAGSVPAYGAGRSAAAGIPEGAEAGDTADRDIRITLGGITLRAGSTFSDGNQLLR